MLPSTDTGGFHMHQPEILMQQKDYLGLPGVLSRVQLLPLQAHCFQKLPP